MFYLVFEPFGIEELFKIIIDILAGFALAFGGLDFPRQPCGLMQPVLLVHHPERGTRVQEPVLPGRHLLNGCDVIHAQVSYATKDHFLQLLSRGQPSVWVSGAF